MFNSSKIRVIVWDVDGTWYRPQNDLVKEETKQRALFIAEKLGVGYKTALGMVKEETKKTKSRTMAVSNITGVSYFNVLKAIQNVIDRSKFLSKDQKLIDLFGKLSNFRHAVCTNMRTNVFEKTVFLLGLQKVKFDPVVTPDTSGVMKPDEGAFKMVLEKTGLKPSEHLFVGDREGVDIVPAKKLGMQTCFVWGKSGMADISIETVYDLDDIMLL